MACITKITNRVKYDIQVAALDGIKATTAIEAYMVAQKINDIYKTTVVSFEEVSKKEKVDGNNFRAIITVPLDLVEYYYNKEEEAKTAKPVGLKPTIKMPKDANLLDWATKQYEARSIYMEQPTSAEKKEYNKTCGK
jgi:hypothetical protein